MSAARFYLDLYLALAALWALVTLAVRGAMRARRVEHAGARAPILAGAIGAAVAWVYGVFFRTPLELRAEARTQWVALVPLALCAALVFVVIWPAMRTKQPPFRAMFGGLSLGPTWFMGSVLWSMASLLADDRLHGVGAAIDPRREHALYVGLGFAAVGLLLAVVLARLSATPEPIEGKADEPSRGKKPSDATDDERAPSRGGRAARRRRRRS